MTRATNEQPERDESEEVAVGLDLRASGVWTSVLSSRGISDTNLSESGVIPEGLSSLRNELEPEGGTSLHFRGVLERLGEDFPVAFENERPEKPHLYLMRLLNGVAKGLVGQRLNPGGIAVVVPSRATDHQRVLVTKAAHNAGFSSASVVNRTTACGFDSLRNRRAGLYLVVVLGHAACEASIIDWGKERMTTEAFNDDPRLSADECDRKIMNWILDQTGFSQEAPTTVGANRLLFWLKQQAELVRRRLDFFDNVELELADGLLGDGERTLAFSRQDLNALFGPSMQHLQSFIDGLLLQARCEPDRIQEVLIGGGFARQRLVQDALAEALQGRPLTLVEEQAAARGAARLLAERSIETYPATSEVGVSVPASVAIRSGAASVTGAAEAHAGGGAADDLLRRVHRLTEEGRRQEASRELARLKSYVEALELSLKDPDEALRKASPPLESGDVPPSVEMASAAPRSSEQQPKQDADATRDRPKASESKGQGKPATAPTKSDDRVARRAYLRAKVHIEDAQSALKKNELAQAVSSSHLAYQCSTDGRIFGAMIEVHLRACRKQPPSPSNFHDHRTWLLCALNDDPTNETVHDAIRARFMLHAEQLLALNTTTAKVEAKKVLEELDMRVDAQEAGRQLLQKVTQGEVEVERA